MIRKLLKTRLKYPLQADQGNAKCPFEFYNTRHGSLFGIVFGTENTDFFFVHFGGLHELRWQRWVG